MYRVEIRGKSQYLQLNQVRSKEAALYHAKNLANELGKTTRVTTYNAKGFTLIEIFYPEGLETDV